MKTFGSLTLFASLVCVAVSVVGCVPEGPAAFDPSSPGLASGCNGAGEPLGRLEGRVFAVPPETRHLPDLGALPVEGTICMDHLELPERRSFPGLGDRAEWFAIEFRGTFVVQTPGMFSFRLTADDGANLNIDGHEVVHDDGFHVPISAVGETYLAAGPHAILLPYWQGPGPLVLILEVSRPGEPFTTFRVDQPLVGDGTNPPPPSQ